jgi:3-hydroxybutyryl-CoA dehydratase
MPSNLAEKHIKDMRIGDKAYFTKTISESDIYQFAGVTGDFNRIHVDEEYAKTTSFGRRIAHGFLTASLVQNCLTALTTPGGVSLNYSVNMKNPVFIGDTITASAEIAAIREDKPLVTLKFFCHKQDGTICLDGEALIYMMSDK